MSDQNLDYAAIRDNIEKGVSRQKWTYRLIFFMVHLLAFFVTMVAVWGTIATNGELRAVLFDSGSGAAVVVILPTVLWAMMILSHVASLYTETSVGEKAIREKLLMREVGEDILRRAHNMEGMAEKPKRRTSAAQTERTSLTDDGELLTVDDDEHAEQTGNMSREKS